MTNDDLEKATHQVIVTINRELGNHFEGTPEEAFGPAAAEAGVDPETAEWPDVVARLIGS